MGGDPPQPLTGRLGFTRLYKTLQNSTKSYEILRNLTNILARVSKMVNSLGQGMDQILAGLRPGQQAMARWEGGELAVSAVPGAGKSTGMAAAAALTVARQGLNLRRYLVVVTFTRSAAQNIKAKIRQNLETCGLPPLGFTVNTIHSLALQVATRHPDRAGLDLEGLTLIAPHAGHRIIRACVDRWIATHSSLYQQLLEGQHFDGGETERLRRQSVLRTDVLPRLAHTVISEAKSSGIFPEDLRRMAQESSPEVHGDRDGATSPLSYGVLTIAAGLYEEYQAQLYSQDLIDYQDMILGALRVLRDPEVRHYWQDQVFGVFEDEAQDSSPLQSELLEILARQPQTQEPEALETQTPGPINLVRVGDPNQAINSTFTPADPRFFKAFCERCQRQGRLVEMTQAGRSSPRIMAAANFALYWAFNKFQPPIPPTPGPTAPAPTPPREAPFRLQYIQPVDPGDPQPGANPPPEGLGLEIVRPLRIEDTVIQMRQRIEALVSQDSEAQIAILVRESRQGEYLVPRLGNLEKDLGIRLYDVGQQQRQNHVPLELWRLVRFLLQPHSPDALKEALGVLGDRHLIPLQDFNALAASPEQFLYPAFGELDPPLRGSWGGELSGTAWQGQQQARGFCGQLLRARLELPLGDLLSFLAASLGYDRAELATADKLAEQAVMLGGSRSLAHLESILGEVVNSERFEGVEIEDSDSVYVRRGQVTVITMHKAKGLDWDYVLVPFLHDRMIPGDLWVPPPARFLGDFSLPDVARVQVRSALGTGRSLPLVGEALAWGEAQYLKQAEEYRLLYVAMTRAKRLLWLSAAHQAPYTWSKPHKLDRANPCPLIPALVQYLSDRPPGSPS